MVPPKFPILPFSFRRVLPTRPVAPTTSGIKCTVTEKASIKPGVTLLKSVVNPLSAIIRPQVVNYTMSVLSTIFAYVLQISGLKPTRSLKMENSCALLQW